jgi:hypothetical protein
MSAYDLVCARLTERTGGTGRNGTWRCPAHDDNTPSLSVSHGNEGVVLRCHAGCDTADVVAALGLTMADLFDTSRENGQRRILRTHDYIDENGTLLYQTVRFEGTGPDRFRQRRPDGKGGWIWNLKDTRRVIYNLPAVLEAIDAGKAILVAEGEHDADALTQAGAVATTNPLGAANWKPEYTRQLAGAKVAIVIDADDTGRKRGAALKNEFEAAGIEVVAVYEPVKGKDAAEVLGMGYDLDNGFRSVEVDSDEGEPVTDNDDTMLASWCEVDLTAALRGDKTRAEPTILRRSDGRHLLYEGQVNYLHGADGVGKSYVALFATKDVLDDDGHVVWLDWEDPDEVTIVGRLADLGIEPDVILERFHYIHPETEATPTAVAQVCDIVRRYGARLVVVDSIGEAFGVDGVNEDKDNEVTPWMRRVLRPLAATGAGVLPVDHGIKSGDNPLFASGSKRKRAAVTGSHFLVEAPRPLSKEYNGGQLKLTTAKDRHGNYTRGKVAAVIDVAIYPDGGWTVHINPPVAATTEVSANDLALVRAMIRVVRDIGAEIGGPVTQTIAEQSKRAKASATAKRAALQYAAAVGCLDVEKGARGAHLYSYVKDLEDPET